MVKSKLYKNKRLNSLDKRLNHLHHSKPANAGLQNQRKFAKQTNQCNNDCAVRLDSALLYHYWDKLKATGKFPDPFINYDKQTYVLTHADLKAPVEKTLDEICKDPKPGSWEDRILKKIKSDNANLITFIKEQIGEIK